MAGRGGRGLVAVVWFFVRNASDNMVKAGIASGFRFLWRDSGIEVPFNLTGYKPSDTILALLWTGIVNTLLVSVVAIVVATVIGFTVGLLRLSRNWLLSTLAGFYIEFVRNIPLLFFVLFWYFGVLAALPTPRESLELPRRRLPQPPRPLHPDAQRRHRPAPGAARDLLLIAVQCGLARWARARQARTGRDFPTWLVGFVLCGALPLAGLRRGAARSTTWDVPTLRGFNYRGGFVLVPEFVALFAALSTYTAGFIAEVGARRHPVGAAGPDRRRPRARPHAGPHRAAGRDPAGHAGDHPADHQPVSQPDQELLVRRGHRLPRDRGGVHGLGAGLDRPVDRDHRHHARRSI